MYVFERLLLVLFVCHIHPHTFILFSIRSQAIHLYNRWHICGLILRIYFLRIFPAINDVFDLKFLVYTYIF